MDKREGTAFLVLFYKYAYMAYVTGAGPFAKENQIPLLQVCVPLYLTEMPELGLGVRRNIVSKILEDV